MKTQEFRKKSKGKSSLADEIRFYLDMKYSQKIRLQDVAEKFHIHPNYMTRIFREKFQVAPKQYLMELKLKRQVACLIRQIFRSQ